MNKFKSVVEPIR
jgi:hypothetical protein